MRLIRFQFIIWGLSLSSLASSQAQNLEYVREVVNTLSAPEFHGRGYVQSGDGLAADYIAKEFEALGLKPVLSQFIQPFDITVNTMPGIISLKLNGRLLVPGKDYLVDPGSPSIRGRFETIILNPYDLLDEPTWSQIVAKARGKFLVIEDQQGISLTQEQHKIANTIQFLKQYKNGVWAGVIELVSKKLIWHGSTDQNAKPMFTIADTAVVENIHDVEVEINSDFIKDYTSQNVVGRIEGQNADSILVFTAHYDHLGRMGEATYFPGANDNASGIAMLLQLASHYSAHRPTYTMVFIAFGGEELGLLGSKYFTEHPPFQLDKIKFLINFDLAGTGDGGIQVVNGSVHQKEFQSLVALNDRMGLLPQVKIRAPACNSDHCLFHQLGVRCFYIYTLGGIQAYHDIYDRADTLPLTEFEDYFSLMVAFIAQL